MHMADALISPAVGGTFWAISAGLIGYSCRQIRTKLDDSKIPLMGVTGAFVFAAQMINFAIPATGSSGHLGGGMILAILLGPWAGFLVMASILTIQALFFADGGLLALGCNIFNLGFWTCFVAYPFIYKKIAAQQPSQTKLFWASIISAVLGLQLGAFSVVMQTVLSGISELPFGTFIMTMLPIHLAIGIVEGFVTAGVVRFIAKTNPQIIYTIQPQAKNASLSVKYMGLILAAVIIGGMLSWFASSAPDGLEWSMLKTAGREELEPLAHPLYDKLDSIQEKTAFLPDYSFKQVPEEKSQTEPKWPAVSAETTISGLVGVVSTLVLSAGIGFLLKW
ncbi:MAG TPA: energy-coupling factor ABC transporter permease [Anaerohalosphaeraceae bacterium]|nr:energy-coupling factor ABC transporter permease [Anaerohalosphaeraceae bacterium]HOL32208.1 energy-coupling factor ABC transporter permease [Anaerohalosphaeraceae bacterium]HOM76918.1 energy-coupling factor ABC transporter permease [Anaerohalosphaeraceae bacterium]HPO69573.1 energy-coupling factor ABC transporter permease [Anaerohalosphaeraceae bacterium]HRS71153.1 energy-coupling factor ABC transporter permease [Anaerohalosphaeraceae bacterium]